MSLTDKKISKWIDNGEFARMLVKLPDASYKQRALIADQLHQLRDPRSLDLLKALLKDDVAIVSQTAAKAISATSQDESVLALVDKRLEKLARIEANKAARSEAFFVKPTEEEEMETMRRMAVDPNRGARKAELKQDNRKNTALLIGSVIILGILLLWRLLVFFS